jgi:hypothetical protein
VDDHGAVASRVVTSGKLIGLIRSDHRDVNEGCGRLYLLVVAVANHPRRLGDAMRLVGNSSNMPPRWG